MIYLFRIFGYPLVMLIIQCLTDNQFDDTEKTNILCFFCFLVTVESLASMFDFPFRLLRRRQPMHQHG